VLCIFRIPPEQKPDSLFPGKFPSLRCSEYRWSNSLRNIRLQQALEFRRRSLILLRYPAEQPLLLRSRTTTLEQIALWEILVQEEI
jgi:hypothetical protein